MAEMSAKTAPAAPEQPDASVRGGVFLALAAYGLWGVFPLYFKLVQHVPALEILFHRALWALPAVALILALQRGWGRVRIALSRPRTRMVLLVSAVVISANWLLWTYAVVTDRVLQSALGYYVTPLLSVALGATLLRERLNGAQLTAVALASAGVLVLAFSAAEPPWIALGLALSFGTYGLLRKQVAADASTGLFIETLYMAPVFAVGLIWMSASGQTVAAEAGWGTIAFLALAGPATAAPLLLFAAAARRLRLSTVGLIQYITPTGHFLVAMAFGEPFTTAHAVTFALIWTGLGVFTWDAVRARR